MDGEMHAADIATVVKRHSGVLLILQRQAQGVSVEVRERSSVRTDQEDCRHAIDQEPTLRCRADCICCHRQGHERAASGPKKNALSFDLVGRITVPRSLRLRCMRKLYRPLIVSIHAISSNTLP